LSPEDAQYRWSLARLERNALTKLFRDEATRDRVIAHYRAAERLAPRDARIGTEAAQLLLATGDPAGARRWAERALAIEPAAVAPRLVLAESLLDVDDGARRAALELVREAESIAERYSGAPFAEDYSRSLLTLDPQHARRLRRRLGLPVRP
jgi:hypothetical protein